MYKVYGITNCDTVQKSLTWLKEHGIAYEFHDYKKKGISAEKLAEWLEQYPWEKLVNRAGMTWRQLPDEEKATDAESATKLMMAKTSVIKRPIIEVENASGQHPIVALGFNAAEYEKLIS